MPFKNGDRLGRYLIVDTLGAGGMGEVYLARDPDLDRKVALKVLRQREFRDATSLARFAQEARAASSLNHPNIVTIYEIGLESSSPYIAMEYVQGRDLRAFVEDAQLSMKRLLDMAAQIADGLAAAHDRGIVHRDLKPENVMVTEAGVVKILDFGLAKLTQPAVIGREEEDEGPSETTLERPSPNTSPGAIVGTVSYMSPEQVAGRQLDFRSDQFSFGTILYELVTHRKPFLGDTAVDMLSAILHDDPRPIAQLNPKAPAPLRWIIDRCLAKEREERYASTRDLAHELRILRDRLAETTSSEAAHWGIHPAPVSKRFKMTATVVALLAMAAIAWMFRRPVAPELSLTAMPHEKSVAVLPFADLSSERSSPLLGTGLAESVSVKLASIPGIAVIRPSSDIDGKSPNDIARMTGANLLLRGAVQRSGDRVRVTWSVIRANDGVQVAGQTLNGAHDDLFALEDALATSVVESLGAAPGSTAPHKTNRVDPASHDRYLQALGYLQRYDNEASVDGAVQILEQLRSSQQDDAGIAAALGRAYLAKFKITRDSKWSDAARAACNRALALEPRDPDTEQTLGELFLVSGNAREAAERFRRVLVQRPSSVDATLDLADALDTSGDTVAAEQTYRRAIELNPSYWASYNQLGVVYLYAGKLDSAERMFKKVIELTPDNIRGYNNLGGVYQQKNRYDQAIAVFQQSIARQPNSVGFSNLGTCYYFQGRYAEAADAFDRATHLNPTDHTLWTNLGDACRWVKGMEARADEAYDRAIALMRSELQVNPSNAVIRARLGLTLSRRGMLDDGAKEIASAVATDAKNSGILYKAALVAQLRNRPDETIEWLRRAKAAGFNMADAASDPELAPIRSRRDFQQLVAAKD